MRFFALLPHLARRCLSGALAKRASVLGPTLRLPGEALEVGAMFQPCFVVHRRSSGGLVCMDRLCTLHSRSTAGWCSGEVWGPRCMLLCIMVCCTFCARVLTCVVFSR